MKATISIATILLACAAPATCDALIGDEPPSLVKPNAFSLQAGGAKLPAMASPETTRIAVISTEKTGLDVTKMSDTELRLVVQSLVARIDVLEREVSELKSPKPRIVLLRK